MYDKKKEVYMYTTCATDTGAFVLQDYPTATPHVHVARRAHPPRALCRMSHARIFSDRVHLPTGNITFVLDAISTIFLSNQMNEI